MFYSDDEYKTYKGFRLLDIDGSMVTLPYNEDIKKEFCTTNVINQSHLQIMKKVDDLICKVVKKVEI